MEICDTEESKKVENPVFDELCREDDKQSMGNHSLQVKLLAERLAEIMSGEMVSEKKRKQGDNSRATKASKKSRYHSGVAEETSEKTVESLAPALHKVSAREAKEKLSSTQAKESYESHIEYLRFLLKARNQKYETLLDEAKRETDILSHAVEESVNEFQRSKTDWEQKVQDLANSLKKSEEQNCFLEKELHTMANLKDHMHTEEETCTMREEDAHLKYRLKEVKAEVVSLQEALRDAKSESMRLKERMLDKETELQNLFRENEELRAREAIALKKVEELSKLLLEATTKKQPVELQFL